MGLTKATLQKLPSATKGQPGAEVAVQFNPTSLRVSTTNQTESGQALGVRKRGYLASGAAKLTLQLVFDTADEGTTASPVSVRGRTRLVTQFLEPEKQGKKQAPPAVRFHWGEFIFDGIMDSATEDIDLFAWNGTPLRAKVDVTITGQRVKDLKLESGPGASASGSPPVPGEPSSAGPGTDGGLPTDQTAQANGGESAAAFAARQGLDPAAWRSFANQVDDPLSLPAGRAIDFSAAAATASGLGSASGFQSGVVAAAGAAVDLARAAAASPAALSLGSHGGPGSDGARRAGFALAAAGGVVPAVEAAQTERADQAAADAIRSFSPSSSSASPTSPSTPAPASAAATPASGRAAGGGSPVRASVMADPRQRAYGFGVPLRARIAPAAQERAAVVFGSRTVGARTPSIDPPTTDDPTVAPWVELPADRRAGSRGARQTAGRRSCGCGGGCGCGCGGSR